MLKMSQVQMVHEIEKYRKILMSMGLKEIDFVQLPYHRKEVLAFGRF